MRWRDDRRDSPHIQRAAYTITATGSDELLRRVMTVVELTADNYSSLYQDMEQGRETEIEAITGFLLGKAAAHGIVALQKPVSLETLGHVLTTDHAAATAPLDGASTVDPAAGDTPRSPAPHCAT